MCWNCDGEAPDTIGVALRVPSGPQIALVLCRPCYTTHYLPLTSEVLEPSSDVPGARTVLVVDDDPGILKMLTAVLSDKGFTVDTATDGHEALRSARHRAPDAIVLDLRMPVMNGQDFLRAWRQTTPNPSVPILAISAYEPRPTAEALGVDAFLAKPFDVGALMDTVETLLSPTGRDRGEGVA